MLLVTRPWPSGLDVKLIEWIEKHGIRIPSQQCDVSPASPILSALLVFVLVVGVVATSRRPVIELELPNDDLRLQLQQTHVSAVPRFTA